MVRGVEPATMTYELTTSVNWPSPVFCVSLKFTSIIIMFERAAEKKYSRDDTSCEKNLNKLVLDK